MIYRIIFDWWVCVMGRILKPVSVISGRLGHSGEEKVSEFLAENLPDSYVILNSPRISYLGEDIDIDHIVIGPNGVFAIESKNMRGKISGGLMGNWIQKSYRTGKLEKFKIGNPANQVSHYSKIIRQFIKTNYQVKFNTKILFKVFPIVVFSHRQADLRELEFSREGYIGRVRVLKLDHLKDYILSTQLEESIAGDINKIADIIVPVSQRDQTGIFNTSLSSLAIEEPLKVQEELINNRYLLNEEIGRGSFGSVYKGHDTKLDRKVAIKKLYTSLSGDPHIVERFFREAKITAHLKHENIVSIYDYYEENNDFYLIMEFIEGQTLDKYMQYHVLSEEEIIGFALDICSALSHAHDNNVVHRDLKPSNILVTTNKKIKVTDFGIASIGDYSILTQTNSSLGSPITMSPEQINGKLIDYRSDIFALGVILYFLNTRELPFKGNNIGEVVHKILNIEPEKPSKLNPNIPSIMEKIIDKSLEKHPDDRYQSVQEIGASILKAYHYHAPYVFTEGSIESQWANNKRSMGRLWRKLLNRRMHRALLIFLLIFSAGIYIYVSKFYFNFNQHSSYSFYLNENISTVLENPGEHAGDSVQLTGKLSGHLKGKEGMDIYVVDLLPTPKSKIKQIFVVYYGGQEIWNNQRTRYFSIGGRIADDKSEITVLGENIEAPLITDARVSPINQWDITDPAISTQNINQSIQTSTTIINIEKLEFAKKETRAFVSVYQNPQRQMVYDFSTSFIEYGGRKYKFINLPANKDYPSIPSRFNSSNHYYGIITFEPITPNIKTMMRLNLININPINVQENYILEINNPIAAPTESNNKL